MNVTAYIDGASLGNPGDAGYGVILLDDTGAVFHASGRYIGKTTNNVAEYQGLIGCLSLLDSVPVRSLTVYSDSELLVNQMNGSYRVKQPHLLLLYNQIQNFLQRRPLRFHIEHIPREKNKDADRLAKSAAKRRSDVDESRFPRG